MRGALGCVLVVCGCGSVSSTPDAATVGMDTLLTDSPVPVDAAPPRCDATKPFANPMPVAGINSPSNDFAARLSPDELTIYWGSNRGGGAGEYDIYMATRTSNTAAFGSPARLTTLAGPYNDSDPMPTRDGLGLLFTRNATGQPGATDLYLATRPNVTSDFTSATALTSVNSTAEETNPFLAEADNVLYFTSTRNGANSYDIYRATRQTNGSYAQVEVVAATSSTNIDAWPVGTQDGLHLYFASNRTAGNLLRVSRLAAGGSFGAPAKVTELDTSADEGPTWISDDGCVLYFHSDRTGGLGMHDIWSAARPQ